MPSTTDNPAASPADNKITKLTPLPRHLAIIMDGNGRWARERGLTRPAGHRAGAERVRDIVEYVGERRVPYLTLYAFSAENWNRPRGEVRYLMTLLEQFVDKNLARLHEENVRVQVLGERQGLSRKVAAALERSESLTQANTGLHLQLAFNYGGQQEIVGAARALARAVRDGELALADLTQERFAAALYTGDLPPCDLLIRTGREHRLSNFLLWQAAYAELYFERLYWPDFDRKALDAALADYATRQRRFGELAWSDNVARAQGQG